MPSAEEEPQANPATNFQDDSSIESLLNELQSEHKGYAQSSGLATPEQLEIVVKNIAEELKLTLTPKVRNQTILSSIVLAQEGATSPRFADTHSCNYFIEGFTVKILRNATSKARTMVRKLARTLRSEAIQVYSALEIPGNLVKAYKLEVPDYQQEHLVWVSDFQTFSTNESMPL